ncbi:MAG: porin [Chitinophagaceae bacterium]|nr:porin [Chitinophagaceae bacterium]
MKKILSATLLFIGTNIIAQDSTGVLTISGYAEAYYQYDFNKPADNNRPGFIYSHNRHNEFNLNLGFVKANYTAERVRANLALGAGTYMNANYAAEPGVLKNIFEANAGFKISKKKNLWIDAGIMPSHIGFESAVSKDCWTLTRSILAENSPYFEAGAKISYTTDDGKWLLSGMALNGWQRITRVSGNSLMSWGAQIQYKPSSKVLLNYSNFIGTDKPDSARLSRFFHNLYCVFNVSDQFGITLGFDIGTEEKSPGSTDKNTWYSPVIIVKYAPNSKWALAGRVEHYNDKNGVIIATGSPNGFQTTGYSLNIDHSPAKNVLVRLELRSLNSKDNIFAKPSGFGSNNTFITSSIAVSF